MAGAKGEANTEAWDAAGGGGGGDSFSEQRLVAKLNKLNNSAASIQTLSQWCIFHRKRARRVVDTWEKQFNNTTEDKKISYLYLSNDILQNSKRKGGAYVNEFWRVLPRSLKRVYENGEEGKKVVARLIGIWDERKVFGTHVESLKDDILGGSLPTLDSNGKDSNPSSNPSSNPKPARKESGTIIKKVTVGGIPEKIVTAYQSVLDKHFDEDIALNKCKSTISGLEKVNKDVDNACNHGIHQGSSLISDLQEQETTLKQCIEQLESVNTSRATLINQLREALNEQESKAELLRSQLQVAREEAELVMQLRQRLGVGPVINGTGFSSRPMLNAPPSEQTSVLMQGSGVRPISPQLQSQDPATSNPATVVVGDEPKKTAAAMADKLASLEAPEEVLSSVFNKMIAEAASKNCGSPSGELSAGAPGFQLEKRPRIEKPTIPSDIGGTPPFLSQTPQVQQQMGGVPTSVGGTQQSTPGNQALGLFPPTPPPLPSLLPPLLQQFAQNSGGMIGMGPFSLMPGSMPPPPPLSNILSAGFLGPSGPLPPPPPPPPLVPSAQSQPQQQSPQAPQISSTSAGFFQSSGIGFFPTVQHSPLDCPTTVTRWQSSSYKCSTKFW